MKPGPQASALRSKWVPVWPSWPVVPPRLWLTGASIGVLVLSLVFKQELWPNHPRAAAWCWALLVLLVLVGGAQSARLLWAWATAHPGPGWVRLLLRGAGNRPRNGHNAAVCLLVRRLAAVGLVKPGGGLLLDRCRANTVLLAGPRYTAK